MYTFKEVNRGNLELSSPSFPRPSISEQTSPTSTLWLWEFQLGVSDGSLQQLYPKGNTCKSLYYFAEICANTHLIAFRISAHVVSGLTLQHNPVCQAEHAPVAPTTSHHQAFSTSTPSCARASESCSGFLQRMASKPGQLTISTTCWQGITIHT